MALSSSFMLLMFSSLLVASLVLNASTVDGSRKVVLKSEGHPIIDLKDPRVQEIGKFAVNEHNKEAKTNLVYKSVIKGEVFLDTSGTSYWLTILTTNNDKYLANVLDRPLEHGSRKAVLKSEGHPIKDLNDPRVQEIGKFAVNEHNKEAKTNLVYKSVIKGEVFLDISGTYYRLTILATNNDKYVADVIDRPLERLRKLFLEREMEFTSIILLLKA
ncbi:hypothetical protein LguiA_030433 [Lonicera macranthoides]